MSTNRRPVSLDRPALISALRARIARMERAGAAPTRQRVRAAPSGSQSRHEIGDPAWNLDLLRCRGGRGSNWRATWHEGKASLVTEEGAARSAPARRRA